MDPHISNPEFQELLVTLLLKDEQFCRKYGSFLKADHFKPADGEPSGRDRWIIASKALEHWEQNRYPMNKELGGALAQYVKDARLNTRRAQALIEYGEYLRRYKITGVSAIEQKVQAFREHATFAKVIDELVSNHSSGTLTLQEYDRITLEIAHLHDTSLDSVDYFETYEQRISRRLSGRDKQRYPALLIPPLDFLVRAVARGQVGLVIAPYKRGKSLCLLWLALAYAMQRLNVLFITLEDPRDDLEDRLDACTSNTVLKELHNQPDEFKEQFIRFAGLVRGRIRIVDGTQHEVGMKDVEDLWLRERENGFVADVVIVDYDDEIKPRKHNHERRFEIAEIYRDARRFAAKTRTLFWTAAQTQRGTEDIKVLDADRLAEDISKVRKVSFALSLGKGEYPGTIFLFVAAHKNDRQRVGVHIVPDYERMMFYDDEATARFMRKHQFQFGDDQTKSATPPASTQGKRPATKKGSRP